MLTATCLPGRSSSVTKTPAISRTDFITGATFSADTSWVISSSTHSLNSGMNIPSTLGTNCRSLLLSFRRSFSVAVRLSSLLISCNCFTIVFSAALAFFFSSRCLLFSVWKKLNFFFQVSLRFLQFLYVPSCCGSLLFKKTYFISCIQQLFTSFYK